MQNIPKFKVYVKSSNVNIMCKANVKLNFIQIKSRIWNRDLMLKTQNKKGFLQLILLQ